MSRYRNVFRSKKGWVDIAELFDGFTVEPPPPTKNKIKNHSMRIFSPLHRSVIYTMSLLLLQSLYDRMFEPISFISAIMAHSRRRHDELGIDSAQEGADSQLGKRAKVEQMDNESEFLGCDREHEPSQGMGCKLRKMHCCLEMFQTPCSDTANLKQLAPYDHVLCTLRLMYFCFSFNFLK